MQPPCTGDRDHQGNAPPGDLDPPDRVRNHLQLSSELQRQRLRLLLHDGGLHADLLGGLGGAVALPVPPLVQDGRLGHRGAEPDLRIPSR